MALNQKENVKKCIFIKITSFLTKKNEKKKNNKKPEKTMDCFFLKTAFFPTLLYIQHSTDLKTIAHTKLASHGEQNDHKKIENDFSCLTT